MYTTILLAYGICTHVCVLLPTATTSLLLLLQMTSFTSMTDSPILRDSLRFHKDETLDFFFPFFFNESSSSVDRELFRIHHHSWHDDRLARQALTATTRHTLCVFLSLSLSLSLLFDGRSISIYIMYLVSEPHALFVA